MLGVGCWVLGFRRLRVVRYSMRTRALIVCLGLVSIGLIYGAQRNESSRIAIKRATDSGATQIPRRAKRITIEEMLAQVRPEGLAPDISTPEFQEKRVPGFETTKWLVDATITEVVKRADGDFYCVIEGKSGARTVFEAPDPELCKGSHFLDEIKKVRKTLDDKFHPTEERAKVNIKVQLTGLGFFGFQGRAQDGSGARTNGARLMPVLNVKVTE